MSRYIYESRNVSKGRKTKYCAGCGETIAIGEPSITITCFSDEFYTEDVCNEECKSKFEVIFEKGCDDDEDEEDED
jgi:hypothetical protein